MPAADIYQSTVLEKTMLTCLIFHHREAVNSHRSPPCLCLSSPVPLDTSP